MKGTVLLNFVLAALLTGCGILPSRKSESQSLKAAESLRSAGTESFKRVTQGTPAPEGPALRVGGLLNRVEVKSPLQTPPAPAIAPGGIYAPAPAPTSTNLSPAPFAETVEYTSSQNTDAKSTEAAKGKYSVSIPLGVSIGLVGVGLVALVWGIRAVRRSSAAADAAFQAADGVAAGLIRRLRDRATASTDPSEIAQIQTDVAHLEAERGRMSR